MYRAIRWALGGGLGRGTRGRTREQRNKFGAGRRRGSLFSQLPFEMERAEGAGWLWLGRWRGTSVHLSEGAAPAPERRRRRDLFSSLPSEQPSIIYRHAPLLDQPEEVVNQLGTMSFRAGSFMGSGGGREGGPREEQTVREVEQSRSRSHPLTALHRGVYNEEPCLFYSGTHR